MLKIFRLFFIYFIIFGVRESDAAVAGKKSVVAAKNVSLIEDAAVITEAHPLHPSRSSRQFRYDSYSPISWVQSLGEGAHCLTSNGRLGSCISLQKCSPYIRSLYFISDDWNDNSLNDHSRCTYLGVQAQPVPGICCTTIITSLLDNSDPFSPEEQIHNSLERLHPWPPQIGSFPDIGTWPAAIPASPAKQDVNWPPPIPTHPPNHHYPTHPPTQGSASASPHPTTTQKPIQGSTTSNPTTYTECGMKNGASPDSERIVGGQNSSPHEFPWIVVLFNKGRQFCGGSLIDDIHVLTAAHCVAQMNSWDVAGITANLGDHNIRTPYEVKHVERRIKRLVRHKGFDFSTLHNDVAVLTLDRPVTFSNEVRPVCLPSISAKSYSGHIATVAGWGSLRENGPQPSILQKVQIPIWTNHECARKYGRAAPGGIIESMICAGQASRDSCSGDSGGPMVINDNGRWTQIGIVSWGIGCGKGQYPGVYSRVSSFLPWIKKNLK